MTPRLDTVFARLEIRTSVRFLAAFALILAIKWPTLFDPPVWDTAMALFPAAITLAGNNFDLVALLGMPGYGQGGPNIHGTSLVTLATALVLKFTGGGGSLSFAVLRLLHFALAAYGLAVLFQLARRVFDRLTTAAFCLAVLLFPLFSVQVGYLYFEMPLFVCAVAAIRAWTDRRFWPAVLWATCALAVKASGIIVPGTLVAATLLEHRSVRDRIKRVALVLTPPAILGAVLLTLHRLAQPEAGMTPYPMSVAEAYQSLLHYLVVFDIHVPDLWALFLTFVATVPVFASSLLHTLRLEPTLPGQRSASDQASLALGYSGLLVVMFILLFTVALPIVVRFPALLPRYAVVVVPFLLLWFGHIIQRFFAAGRPSAVAACFATLAIVFAINTNGMLYPSDIDTDGPGNSPALTERSNAYRQLMAAEMEAVRSLRELPDDAPVYYSHYEHYLFQYPGLGYTDGPLANGHHFGTKSVEDVTRRDAMAPCTYALLTYPWLGGDRIRQLLEYVTTQDDLSSDVVREFRHGRYVMTLYVVRKKGAVCAQEQGGIPATIEVD